MGLFGESSLHHQTCGARSTLPTLRPVNPLHQGPSLGTAGSQHLIRSLESQRDSLTGTSGRRSKASTTHRRGCLAWHQASQATNISSAKLAARHTSLLLRLRKQPVILLNMDPSSGQCPEHGRAENPLLFPAELCGLLWCSVFRLAFASPYRHQSFSLF